MISNDSNRLDPSQRVSQHTLLQLDNLLTRSAELERFLKLILANCPAATRSSDIKMLQHALSTKLPASRWTNTPTLASKLSLLIRFDQLGQLRHDEIIELANKLLKERSNWKGVLFRLLYPLSLLSIVLGIALLLLLFVIPNFSQMFNEFGLRVPTVTKAVIGLSDILREGPVFFLLTMFMLFAIPLSLWLIIRMIISLCEFISLVGFWTNGSKRNLESMARWSSTLADLIDIDIPLPDAISIAGVASNSRLFRRQSGRLSHLLQNDTNTISTALTRSVTNAFPDTTKFALIANEGKPSPTLLRQQAVIYQARANNRRLRSGGIFGPIAIISIGLFVALIVIAIFLPLVSLVTALS